MAKKKKATVKDVAAMANTSITTVSRVLSGSDYPVKEELRTAILEAARALDYKPNIFGQMLRGATSRQIGVVLPSIVNPFYSQLFTAVQNACRRRGYVPILYSSYNDRDTEQYHIDMLISSQVAGVLLSLICWEDGIRKKLEDMDIPYVLFDQPHEEYSGLAVDFDFYAGGRMAADYLLQAGHQDILFATGPLDRPSRRQMLHGFKDSVENAGYVFGDDQVLIYKEGIETGVSAMKDYESGRILGEMILGRAYLPDAVFAVNDMVAIGIIKKFEEGGVRVPADVSVLGFDNVEFGEMMVPALSTISQSAYKTGKLAADLLFESMDGHEVRHKRILLEPILIERESVRKKHNKIRRSSS